MATSKLFTVAGVSTQNGNTKIRFANDVMRVKVLAKNGHTDIMMIELPEAMTKVNAAKFLMTLPEFEGMEAQTAIADYLDKYDIPTAVDVDNLRVELTERELETV